MVVGPDTVIHPGVYLEGRTQIGAACEIHSGVRIVNSVLADRVTVQNFCVITGSRLASNVTLGPFVHLRPESDSLNGAHREFLVEPKEVREGRGEQGRASLAYLGDATNTGENVNIGAGTITCNYDGAEKHQTVIEDGVSNREATPSWWHLVSGPRRFRQQGTTVREDVPAGALGVSAGKQRNITDWVKARREKPEA